MRVGFGWMILATVLFALGCGGSQKAAIKVGAMPAGGSFTGVWFSPQYGEMHIIQNGATAIGRYSRDERSGRLQGSVTGDVMRFEWTETRELIVGRPTKTKGHGYFRVLKDTSEDTWKLLGEWGHDANETGGGQWNAVRSKNRRPTMNEGETGGSSGGDSGSSDESTDESSSDSDSEASDLNDL